MDPPLVGKSTFETALLQEQLASRVVQLLQALQVLGRQRIWPVEFVSKRVMFLNLTCMCLRNTLNVHEIWGRAGFHFSYFRTEL